MIEVNNLTKVYGQHRALDNVSFTVSDDEILGFLGPNGAGKTTTMNILTGYLSATSGEAKINGIDILDRPEEKKKQIGYLPEIPPLYTDMKVIEYLDFAAKLKQMKESQRAEAIQYVMEVTRITDMSKRLIANLSKGYKQRVGLAQAILGDPRVLILDEPTVGLDPKQIIEIRNLIKSLSKKHTIILSSHVLSEVSAVCDRVVIINKGQIVASDTPERLSSRLSENRYLVRIKGEEEAVLAAFAACPDFSQVQKMDQVEEGTAELLVVGKEGLDVREQIFRLAVACDFVLLLCKSEKLSLEDIFLRLTEGDGLPEAEEAKPQAENAQTDQTAQKAGQAHESQL